MRRSRSICSQPFTWSVIAAAGLALAACADREATTYPEDGIYEEPPPPPPDPEAEPRQQELEEMEEWPPPAEPPPEPQMDEWGGEEPDVEGWPAPEGEPPAEEEPW
jgi:hypothetical protein